MNFFTCLRQSRTWTKLAPHASAFFWDFFEGGLSVLSFLIGALIAWDLVQKRWAWASVQAVIALFLAWSTFRLQRNRRKRIEADDEIYAQMMKALEEAKEENARLRQVALSAAMLKILIEHGLPPDLTALNRDLAEVFDEINVMKLPIDSSRMN